MAWRLPVNGSLKGYAEGQQFGVTNWYRPGGTYFHDGYDFGSLQYPHTLYAVGPGKITFTGVLGDGLGSVIILESQGYNVMYQEFGQTMGAIKVVTGQTVSYGTVVGTMVTSHLHLGMTKQPWRQALGSWNKNNGTWVNPIPILTSSPAPAMPVTPAQNKPAPPKKPESKVATCQALVNYVNSQLYGLFDKYVH